MQISNVAAGYPDSAALGKQGEPSQAPASGTLTAVELPPASTADSRKVLAKILSKYDVTDISPTEFAEMIQKLYEAGVISEKELQQLAAIRHDMDVEGVEPDKPIDLLEFYARKIQKLQRRFDKADGTPKSHEQLGPMLRRLDWAQKFALIQSAPDAMGLDLVVGDPSVGSRR